MCSGFLKSSIKKECCGCEACAQVCPKSAIDMIEDNEGFRYPIINQEKCIKCGLCNNACQYEVGIIFNSEKQCAFGGYSNHPSIRMESTSGGAFSEIVDAWCFSNYVIFGARADGLRVFHTYIFDKNELQIFRKSKYSQSIIGKSYAYCKKFLLEGKTVVFSGTPCQISGLKIFLGENIPQVNLLTIEVICEGLPSPLYIRKLNDYMLKKYGSHIEKLDYRYKEFKEKKAHLKIPLKWDFEVMLASLQNHKVFKIDRWFNPFWSIWLNHLMSRPSCYECKYTQRNRVADITLGDLWGVHIYCPELYGRNGGASLIICNTDKGRNALEKAKNGLYGHELDFETALKYQGPMRKPISDNSERINFMRDLQTQKNFKEINRKWAEKPTLKLLWQKYIWGNRQKVALWNIKQGLKKIFK